MKDNQMMRGKSQSLYKYLPESWIDFSIRGSERKQYTAKVLRWNSIQLTDINRRRLLRKVSDKVEQFCAQANTAVEDDENSIAPTAGFGTIISEDTYDVLTPKADGEERGIVANISPLTFYCPKCMRVYQFRNINNFRKYTKCRDCHVELTQIKQVYVCKCGWASDKHPVYCREHGSSSIYWDGKFDFYCKKCGKRSRIPMISKCEICGQMVKPKYALDPSQYFANSLNMIDMIDEVTENFLSDTDYGKHISVAYWLERINDNELHEIIDNGIVSDNDAYQKVFMETYTMFVSVGLDETSAKIAAEAQAKKACGSKYSELVQQLKGKLYTGELSIAKHAESILEYSMVKNSEEITTLQVAAEMAKDLNSNANPEKFQRISNQFGFTNVQVCGRIPFVTCSYGYTRVHADYHPGVQLRAFKEETSGRKNVYANCMETEGVLFEFDRKRIIDWLLKNNYITGEDVPNTESEEEMKLWFVNHIRPELISTFSRLNDTVSPATYYVYRLIHSVSHTLIKSAAELCGLDKNSISEYIFPGIPAVLIYCQNSQGFNLGALNNVFVAYFDKWMTKAMDIAKKCVFDPICLERDKACTGCLFLNEISCEHFNHDLDRTLLIGHYDKRVSERHFGFWEDEKG